MTSRWQPSPGMIPTAWRHKAQAAARQELARRSLTRFTQYTYPQYQVEPFHKLLAHTLEQVARGQINRLMVFAPPQHGKSELVSVRFPAWLLGHYPHQPIILTSYAASLAQAKSRECRNLVESTAYQELFPEIGTADDSRAVDFWRIAGQHGGVLAAGVGGPITGHGAFVGVIDDPFENWAQAQSHAYRERVWDWYRTTFRTRIWEGGAIILVMTRWHSDDLAGRLLLLGGQEWTVLRLPAVAETVEERAEANRRLGIAANADAADPLGREAGEPLAPGRFSAAALRLLRQDVGALAWAAEYQGVPTVAEGHLIKRAWLPIVEALPEGARFVRYWDKAGSMGRGDFTAGVLLAQAGGRFYVVDVQRGQWSALEREAIIKQTAQLDTARGPVAIWLEQEPGSGGKESAEASVRNLAGFTVHVETVTGDKATRLAPFAAQAEAGNVSLLRGAWNGVYLDELTAFPNGANDDQVDGTSGAFNKLTRGVNRRALSRQG